jgi:PTH1 family peptidyl-tRNA hydrolase
MKWIVGLGNPGPRYEATPHNLGFQVVDELARRGSFEWRAKSRADALLAEGPMRGEALRLVKPLSFMNLSGEAVATLTRQAPPSADELLVVTDDVSIPIGRLRIRPSGSHGGHNGLRSVIERLGRDDFARLRIGIRPTWEVEDLVEFVLRRLPPRERERLAEMVAMAADAAEHWMRFGTRATADKFNGIRRFEENEE